MADAQWILDISAEFPEGADVSARLDAVSSELVGAGKRSEGFRQAIGKLSEDLNVARTAADAANAALSEGSSQYKALEREAIAASKALERANAKNAVPLDVKARADAASAALAKYEGELRMLEGAAAQANGAQSKIAKQLQLVEKLGKRVDDQNALSRQKYERIAVAAARLPGPLGRVAVMGVQAAKANAGLGEAFGEGATGALAAAGAVAALVAGMVVSAVIVTHFADEFVRMATTQADATRSIYITRDAFAALDPAAEAAVNTFDDVQDATGLSEDRLLALSKQLRELTKLEHGFRLGSGQMAAALKAAATAEAALGQGGADEFIQRIDEGRLSVKAFADLAEAKFGGIVQRRLLSLDAQSELLKRSFRNLFAAINIEPALAGLSRLVGMLDRTNPTAQAAITLINKLFGYVADNAEAGSVAIEAFVIGFEIGLLKMYIAAKPVIRQLEQLFGKGSDSVFGNAKEIGQIAGEAFTVIAASVAILALALIPVAVVASVLLIALLAIPVAIFAIGFAIGALGRLIYDFVDGALDALADAGANLIKGFIKGILGFADAVVDVVKDVIGGAAIIAKQVLGIHSPSRVFADIGSDSAEGYARGLDDGQDDVNGSMARLVGTDDASAPNGAAPPARTAATKSIDLAGATFVFNGVKDAEQARSSFAELLTMVLEDDAASLAGAQV